MAPSLAIGIEPSEGSLGVPSEFHKKKECLFFGDPWGGGGRPLAHGTWKRSSIDLVTAN